MPEWAARALPLHLLAHHADQLTGHCALLAEPLTQAADAAWPSPAPTSSHRHDSSEPGHDDTGLSAVQYWT